MNRERLTALAAEFLRYVLVGGIAFVADWGTLVIFREYLLNGGSSWELALCTALGFVTGLVVNYVLSVLFVFRKADNKSSGKSAGAFVVFALVGIVGLGLTELVMYIGVYLLKWNYKLTKVLVAGAVLVWNYLGRKILVFGKTKRNELKR